MTEGQLHLIAKLLEYSFNFSRFLPNWRSQPVRRLYRGAQAEEPGLVREWWRWALHFFRWANWPISPMRGRSMPLPWLQWR